MKTNRSYIFLTVIAAVSILLSVTHPLLVKLSPRNALFERNKSFRKHPSVFLMHAGVPTDYHHIGIDYKTYDFFARKNASLLGRYYLQGNPYMLELYGATPWMTLSFYWVRLVSTRNGYILWFLILLLGCFAASFLPLRLGQSLARAPSKKFDALLPVLLLGTYPVLFCLERGNSDILVTGCIVAGLFFFVRQRWFWTGSLITLASFLKVYPSFFFLSLLALGITCLLLGFRKKNAQLGKNGLMLLAGQAVTFLLLALPLWRVHKHYIIHVVFRIHAKHLDPLFDHSVTRLGALGWLLMGALWAGWTMIFLKETLRWIRSDTGQAGYRLGLSFLVLGGSCVYFATLSYDYNLVTLLPLLGFLAARPGRPRGSVLAVTGLLAAGFALPRSLHYLFPAVFEGVSLFLILQIAGLILLTMDSDG